MTGRYNTTGNIEAQYEPGSDDPVLANKPGITDPAEMDDIEFDLLAQLYDFVLSTVSTDQKLSVADLCDWHRRWPGGICSWAGNWRSVSMGKGGFSFAAATQVPRLVNAVPLTPSPSGRGLGRGDKTG